MTTSDMVGPQPRSPFGIALLRGLGERGYVYGQHFVTEHRGAEGKPERYPILAAELVRLQVDVIVGAGPALPALKQATTTIPVVMAAAFDPVAEGLVLSLGRPGGNFTGPSHQIPETTGKRLELLKELVPGAAPVAVLWDQGARLSWQAADAAARARGWKLLSLEIRDAGEIEGAFRAATNARAAALLVLTGRIAFPHRGRIAELAARSRLPAMYDLRPYVEAGGLISHGADLVEIWRQAAGFVDKIFRGAKPGALPIEQPTKFELMINLKTVKALGLTIPQSVLLRADEFIQGSNVPVCSPLSRFSPQWPIHLIHRTDALEKTGRLLCVDCRRSMKPSPQGLTIATTFVQTQLFDRCPGIEESRPS